MPAIGQGAGKTAASERPRKTPAPRPASVPSFTRPATGSRPFAAQQQQAQAKVDRAATRLPRVPIAAPPIIHNPTPTQVHAAHKQLATSVTAAVGSYGTAAQRLARRDALLREIRTQPRYAPVRRSITHWTAEEQKLVTPERAAANARDRVRPGPGPRKARIGVGPVSLATVNLTAAGNTLGAALAKAAPGLSNGSAAGQEVRNALKDVGSLGEAPFVGGYGAGHAILSDVAHLATHPQALSHGYKSESGKFLTGIFNSTAEEVKHPVKSLQEHPVLSLLNAAGAASLAGRTAGAGARALGKKDAGGVRGYLDEHSHVVRPPISMSNDAGQPMIVQRSHSKDAGRRAVQVHNDKQREPLIGSDGKPVTVMDRGREVPVLKSSPGEQARFAKKRGDFLAGRANAAERQVRDEAGHETKVRGVKGKAAKDITALAVQGALTSSKHFAQDLRDFRDMVAGSLADHASGKAPFRHTGDLEAAQANLKLADGILKNPKAMRQGPRVIAEAERIGGGLHQGDVANAAAELGDAQALRRSGLVVPATLHMGARHFTVEEHAALEREAAKGEKAAMDAYATAKSPEDRKAALVSLDTAREHRIAVSGRHPDRVRAHENAQVAHAAAKSRLKAATEAEARAQQRVAHIAAAHRSERGREAHHGPVAAYYVGDKRFTLRQDAVDYLKTISGNHGVLDLDRARSTEPPAPVRAGYVRLYRGEGVSRSGHLHGDWVDAPGDGESYGRWFTDEHARAKGYADEGRGFVAYVDVPADVAKAASHSTTKNGRTFVLPKEWADRAVEHEPGSIARAHDRRAKSQASAAKLPELLRRRTAAKKALGEPTVAPVKPRPRVRIERVALTHGEAKRVGELSQARRAQVAARNARRAAADAARKAEHATKDHPLPPIEAALRYGENSAAKGFNEPAGAYLPNSDIEAFLHSRGRHPDTVAYLPHRQDVRGGRAHHAQFRPGGRPVLDAGETRTGAAFTSGVTEVSTRLIRDQGVRQRVQLNKAQQIDKLVSEHGLAHPARAKAEAGQPLTPAEERIVKQGGLWTAKEALEAAQRLEKDTGQRYTPMVAHSGRLDVETRRVIREDLQGPGAMDSLSQRLLNDRIITPDKVVELGTGTRNVVLVPSQLVERIDAHLRPAGQLERLAQYLNKPFRMAVLPTFKWLAGNFVEPYLVRLPMAGSGLVNLPGLLVDLKATRMFRDAMAKGSPEMAQALGEVEAQQLGSGLFIGGKGATVRRTVSEALPDGAQRAYGKMVSKLPVVDQVAEMGQTAAHWIAAPLNAFFTINRHLIENPAQRAAFGHNFRRDLQALTGSWIKSVALTRKAVAEAAEGYVNTPTQQRAMHAQYELLGKYSGYSPTLRALVQSVAPFLPWALNAARFVFWTMPAHNTVKTALLIKTQQVMAKDWQEIHKDVPPGSLRDAIPNGKGGWIDLARYTPYGLTAPPVAGGDLRSVTSEFLPQFSGFTNAMQGKDPFGRDLKLKPSPGNPTGKPSTGQDFLIGAYDLLEAVTPYLSTARRLREHGETAYAGSNVVHPSTKPNTSHGMSAARRVFDPLRPTYLHAGGDTGPVHLFTPTAAPAASNDPWDAVDQAQSQTDQPTGPDPWDAVK